MTRRRALDRDAVVAAAVELVEREGPGALGISRVARSLGIRPPSLYNHVGSGADLAWGVAVVGWRRLGEGFDAVEPGADPREDLIALCRVYRDFALGNPHLYAVMSDTPVRSDDPAYALRMRASMARLGAGLAALGADEDAVVHALRALRAALHGYALLEAGGQLGLARSPSASWSWMIEAVVGAIATPAAVETLAPRVEGVPHEASAPPGRGDWSVW